MTYLLHSRINLRLHSIVQHTQLLPYLLAVKPLGEQLRQRARDFADALQPGEHGGHAGTHALPQAIAASSADAAGEEQLGLQLESVIKLKLLRRRRGFVSSA